MQTETLREELPSPFPLGRDRTPRLILRPRVMLSEGDQDARSLIRWALRRDGCDVIESRNGEELLDYLSTSLLYRETFPMPDLIVADLDQAGLDPLHVLQGLRSRLRRTPLVLIAADVARVREVATSLQVVGVFGKPIDLDGLRAVVRASIAV